MCHNVTFLSRNRVSVQTSLSIDPVRSLVTPECDAGGSPVVKLRILSLSHVLDNSWLLLDEFTKRQERNLR